MKHDIAGRMVNIVPILVLLAGAISIYFSLIGPAGSMPATYLLIISSLLAASVYLIKEKMTEFGARMNTMACLTAFGFGVSAYSFQIMRTLIGDLSIVIPLLYFLAAATYLTRKPGMYIPLAVSGIIVPLGVVINIANPLTVTGWLVIAGGFMAFDFSKKSSKKKKHSGGEVDLASIPMLMVDEDD